MADYVPLIIMAGVAYYVLVVNPSILQNLTSSLTPAAAAPGGSTAPAPAATPCQGTDKKTGAACTCPTTAAAMAYAYATKKKKSSSKSSSKGSSSGSGSGSTPAPTTSSCDCSACTGASTGSTATTKGSGANIWCLCSGGKWAQDPSFSQKCATIGKTCSTTGAVGYSHGVDLNSYIAHSIANEGLGFNSLQGYHRRYWG